MFNRCREWQFEKWRHLRSELEKFDETEENDMWHSPEWKEFTLPEVPAKQEELPEQLAVGAQVS